MNDPASGSIVFYVLLLVLPLSALLARRVSLRSTAKMAGAWVLIFVVGLLLASQRDRLRPAWNDARDLLFGRDQTVTGGTVRIAMADDGHFYADVRINGVARRMLVDSGATTTALSVATAKAAGVSAGDSPFPVFIDTANGQVEAQTASVRRLELGPVTAHDLPVVVAAAFGDADVLGMNFLSRLRGWRVDGRTLILDSTPAWDLHNVYYRRYLEMSEEAPPIDRLRAIMARLRDPIRGCAWDTVQTFATIAPYTIEEAYEVADAIARNDSADLRDELGDLLLQVVFHARIAEEAGLFDFDAVADAIADKMERRHPHIFGDDAVGGHHRWEQIKADERAARDDAGALAGVALGLPALLRAEKLQRRAARVGFDWPDATGPRAKVDEELTEVDLAANEAQRREEIGDLLFAVVNWARHQGVDAEAALRSANAKFERRFRTMEAADTGFAERSLEEQEALWQAAKRIE